ncbi:hypothetical protein PhCBS80983_g03602 [Powellomyces hirtus]|uniref:Septin-type G domain-containing protein n=1 Tax=Powellomyces hirtus TaxID=109895 RepID=A0A507E352_9FUNG|nr:hypothetical protein PhCBS80983_g03602 [Powellomyces hirtus]
MTVSKPQARNRARRNLANQFNLMVAGHCFTGKTAYIQTLFDSLDVKQVVPDDPKGVAAILPPEDLAEPTPAPARIEFETDPITGERISLRLIDTPGIPIPANIHRDISDDKSDVHVKSIVPHVASLVGFLTQQFERTLLEESKVKRNPKSQDHQVHACLYFLDPQVCFACHGLTPIDRYALEQLCARVNVIVCLGKADLLTVRHLRQLRNMVIDDLARFAIPVFAFPEDPDIEYDAAAIALNEELRGMLPFAIVNSEEAEPENIEPEDHDLIAPLPKAEPKPRILGRRYPWGMVEVENPEHCDFLQVKETLFITHAHELKLLTRDLYYEQWRTDRLLEIRTSVLGSSTSSVKDGGQNIRDSSVSGLYSASMASMSRESLPGGLRSEFEEGMKERQMGQLRS